MSLSGKVFECNRLLVFLTIVCLFVEALESPLLADHYRAFPEIGASLGLRSRLPQSTNGWTEISGWTHTSLSDSGRFLFGAPLSSKASRFQIPKSGIYFVSFSVHLSYANIGLFEATVVVNGKIAKRNKPLSSARQGYQGAEFSLVVSGFVNLGSSEEISVFVFSEKDRDWIIQDNSQFTLRYTGPMGIFPAFSASKGTVMKALPSPLPHAVRNWKISGIPGVFISLTGFSSSTGQFVCICDGIFFLAANIRVQANQGTHCLHTLINNEIRGPFVDVKTYGEHQSIFTMNLYESVYLKRGDTVCLSLNSTSSKGVAILSDSGFSVSYIDVFNQSSLQGMSSVTKTTNEIPGIGWMELTTLPMPSVAHVQFFNPEVFRMGRFTCTQSGIYYIAVGIKPLIMNNKALAVTASLRMRGGKANYNLLVKSSGTSQMNGNAGLYATLYNPTPNAQFSLSVSGLLELSKGQRVSVFVHSTFPGRWFIEPGSGLSVMKTRHYWPAANGYLKSKLAYPGGKWQEIGNWVQSGEEGAFSFGSNPQTNSFRFRVTSPGIYFVSANLLICAKSNHTFAVIAVDGKPRQDNGLYTTSVHLSQNVTLNIAGSLSLQRGQNISVYVHTDTNDIWEINERSGFSAVLIGKPFSVPGFHAVKGIQSRIGTTNWVNIDEWEKPGNSGKSTYQSSDGFDNIRGTFTATISGIYFVSCTLVTKGLDAQSRNSYVEVYIGVNGQRTTTNGLQHIRYIERKQRNDVITISVSGNVQLINGDYTVIRARTSEDSDWKVESTSGFSIFLVSPLDLTYGNVGFLSRKSDTRINFLAPRGWSKIGGWVTQSDLTNGLFLKNDGSFTYEALKGDLIINHAGIYFVSVNIIVSSINSACDLSLLVSDNSGRRPEEIKTGFTSTEQEGNGKVTLQFNGAIFMKKNRNLHVAVRTERAATFTVWEGSGFSVARLIYPIEEPGFYSRISSTRPLSPVMSKWGRITDWETAGASGLHIDGHGFNSVRGNYVVPLPGMYLASAGVSLQNNSFCGIISVKISVNGDLSLNSGLVSSNRVEPGHRAMVMASGILELSQGMSVSVFARCNTFSSFSIDEGSYFTVRYITEKDRTEGNMADRYSNVIFTSPGWKELVSWKTAGNNGQFQVGSIHQTTDRFVVSKGGVYHVTANIKLLETDGLAMIGIVINSGNDTAVIAKKTCTSSLACPLNLAASIELDPRTFVSVHVYSDDKDRWLVSSQSSKSILSLNPIPPSSVVQGFLARLSTNVSVGSRQSSDWFRIEKWTTSGRSGYFKTITGLSSNGVLVVGSSGVYIISVNLILQCTENSVCEFEMLVAFNGRLSPKSGLFSRQTVPSLCSETLTASTVAHLFQWDSLVVAVRSNSSSQILTDSTFSVVMLESIDGPPLCSNLGPSLIQELSPAYLRSRVGSQVTWSCEAVGGTSLKYRWLKNYQVLPNATLNTLTVNSASVQDSGDYVCIAEISPITVSSNVARFTAYDPQPAFESLNNTVYVNENGPTLQLILNISVKAESKGNTRADMAFTIMLGNTNDSFFLMPNTSSTYVGVFVTRPLDRERVSEYQLLVKATNLDEHAQESTTAVRVVVNDINDNAPHFKKKIHDVSILENATLGQVVLILEAVDDDALYNANISYKLVAGSGINTFSLDQTSGEIRLTKLLDRETQPSYSLLVAARDPDFTEFTQVLVTVLDVNEHRPVFNPLVYRAVISESTEIGASVLQLHVTDYDAGTNSQLVFSIIDGDPRNLFAVNKDGFVIVERKLDREKNSTHNITINVRDEGEKPLLADQPAYVFIFVRELNENSPKFERSLYKETISENTLPGTSVLRVRAMDADGSIANNRMVFSIVKETMQLAFGVNSTSGITYVKTPLDFEKTKFYLFQVAVRDISEKFRTDVTTVLLSISDENDNWPVFDPVNYTLSISEATAVGAELVKIYATDKDSTTNAALNYSILAGNENSTFALDESNGLLFLTKEVDYETRVCYRLQIGVSDKGSPSRKAQVPCTVNIDIYDENDNRPRFFPETYDVMIYENVKIGTYLCTVYAVDKDSYSNQELMYVFADYNQPIAMQKFAVNGSTGAIYTKEELDREEHELYKFTVVARDGGKVPLEGFATVSVILIDVNDNPPTFEPAVHQSSVNLLADSPVSSAVITLTAVDHDLGVGGKISYSVEVISATPVLEHMNALECTSASSGTFRFDDDTGTLRVAELLAAMCRYNVTVRAMDNGNPPLFSLTSVVIETGERNAVELKGPTTIEVVSQEDHAKVIVIVCVFALIIVVILVLVIWREGRRHMQKKNLIARTASMKVRQDDSDDEHEKAPFKKVPEALQRHYLDHCSTTTEMPSSLHTPYSMCSFGMETDILESFTLPYDGKRGYSVFDGDSECFCVSIEFGLESDDPIVSTVSKPTGNDIDGKATSRGKARRGEVQSLLSSSSSRRSQASLPAKLGSRNYLKRDVVREVISDTRL